MVESAEYISEKTGYSELQVLQSGGGYYIGTMYNGIDEYGPFEEPGSRDSDYFKTYEAAERYLRILEGGFGAPVRMTP